ncbi:hypothetical protein ACRCUN_32330 [Mycobacterium sp. LTG2003]
MKNVIVAVTGSMAIGFALGGIKASGPAAEVPAPPVPVPGLYSVTESAADHAWDPYDWTLTECGPECLHVLSHSSDAGWQLDLSWSPTADANRGAWVGERTNPGMACRVGTPEEFHTGPFTTKYFIRPDLTGFVNMGFSQDNPSCSGDTETRSRSLMLQRAPSIWSLPTIAPVREHTRGATELLV